GTSGTFAEDQSGTTIVLDREVVVGFETMYVRIGVNSLGQSGSGSIVADYMEVREITATPGTYAAGDPIDIASAFDSDPVTGDPYHVYKLSELFLIEIAEITDTPDMKRRIRWVQYDADIYDVDEPDELVEM